MVHTAGGTCSLLFFIKFFMANLIQKIKLFFMAKPKTSQPDTAAKKSENKPLGSATTKTTEKKKTVYKVEPTSYKPSEMVVKEIMLQKSVSREEAIKILTEANS